METKTSLQEASQENTLVQKARSGLAVGYSEEEIAAMTQSQALKTWEKLVCAEADHYVRSRHHFHG